MWQDQGDVLVGRCIIHIGTGKSHVGEEVDIFLEDR
jgi:hypothetical protein